MRIKNDDYLNGPVYFKFITVGKLKELLNQVPDDYFVNAQPIAGTGNLVIYDSNLLSDLDQPISHLIDIGDESIENLRSERGGEESG